MVGSKVIRLTDCFELRRCFFAALAGEHDVKEVAVVHIMIMVRTAGNEASERIHSGEYSIGVYM